MIPAAGAADTSLTAFCDFYWRRSGRRRIKDPERLAIACRDYYGIKGELRLDELKDLLLHKMGVVAIQDYPSNAAPRGMYFREGDDIILFVRSNDSDDVKLHTLAHELREVLGSCFGDLHPKMKDIAGEDLETQSDAFAATLILGEGAFSLSAFETGLDFIRLGKMYNKSYRTVMRRTVRDLTQLQGPIKFWGVTYEFSGKIPHGVLRSAGACRSPKFGRKSRREMPNSLFAKRGQLVPIKAHLERALRQECSVYIESLTGIDHWGEHTLSVVIRPYKSSKGIDGLMVVAVPKEDAPLLRKQILRCRPIVIEEEFQTI